MNFETYDTPETRSEFELRFHYLHNIMKQGKFHVNANISMEGILKLRKLPNGRIDFLSVNEQARLHANMMYHMRNFKLPDNIELDE
ncbi:AVAST type 1 anti-phage system protein Avs1c [Shewanella putrefaciens]|uniref:AVAST type 1 anti-phage system protein Avs1c n=1 Tax=Shewanella putrefaciens TaxID=24 RepID=UPI003D79C5C0